MVNDYSFDDWFAALAEATAPGPSKVPSRLKSRIYSALMRAETAEGPLESLDLCQKRGRSLCLWERFVQISPVPERIESLNHCYYCPARLVAEHFEGVSLPWYGCPYTDFQK